MSIAVKEMDRVELVNLERLVHILKGLSAAELETFTKTSLGYPLSIRTSSLVSDLSLSLSSNPPLQMISSREAGGNRIEGKQIASLLKQTQKHQQHTSSINKQRKRLLTMQELSSNNPIEMVVSLPLYKQTRS